MGESERNMPIQLVASSSKDLCGRMAGCHAARLVQDALAANGEAYIIVATGASQFEVLETLVSAPGIDWSKVTAFHLDEYVGLSMEHPASFRKYLKERFVDRLPQQIKAFHYISGEGDMTAELERLALLIEAVPRAMDVGLIGIGENAHIAFNDPPADFETTAPYLVVDLDAACRQQQFGEGWFASLDEVPKQAVSMSCRQICAAQSLVCTVPDERKAAAVLATMQNQEPVPAVPSSLLHTHGDCVIFADAQSVSSAGTLEIGLRA